MMSLFTRVLNLFNAGGDGAAHSIEVGADCVSVGSDASRVQGLEHAIDRQRDQLDRAVSLLQSAAFLAGYHQPALERDIRSLLAEIKASATEGKAASDRPIVPRSERISA